MIVKAVVNTAIRSSSIAFSALNIFSGAHCTFLINPLMAVSKGLYGAKLYTEGHVENNEDKKLQAKKLIVEAAFHGGMAVIEQVVLYFVRSSIPFDVGGLVYTIVGAGMDITKTSKAAHSRLFFKPQQPLLLPMPPVQLLPPNNSDEEDSDDKVSSLSIEDNGDNDLDNFVGCGGYESANNSEHSSIEEDDEAESSSSSEESYAGLDALPRLFKVNTSYRVREEQSLKDEMIRLYPSSDRRTENMDLRPKAVVNKKRKILDSPDSSPQTERKKFKKTPFPNRKRKYTS